MTNQEITYIIRGCAYEVYKEIGPGALESIYEEALVYEMEQKGLRVERQKPVSVNYKGHILLNDLRLDIIVEDQVIVELKSVSDLLPIHYKQLYSYLRLASKEVGILINFYVPNILDGMKTVYLKDPQWS